VWFIPAKCMAYEVALWWVNFGTRVLFSDSPLRPTLAIEQFWGRAARASWIRKNPRRPFNFWMIHVARTLLSAAVVLAFPFSVQHC
jgi:hypothetical protein